MGGGPTKSLAFLALSLLFSGSEPLDERFQPQKMVDATLDLTLFN